MSPQALSPISGAFARRACRQHVASRLCLHVHCFPLVVNTRGRLRLYTARRCLSGARQPAPGAQRTDRALEIAPDNAEALQAIALVYQRQGESDLADQHFQRAIDTAPDFTRARNNYAAFLYQEGRGSCLQPARKRFPRRPVR